MIYLTAFAATGTAWALVLALEPTAWPAWLFFSVFFAWAFRVRPTWVRSPSHAVADDWSDEGTSRFTWPR